MNRRRLIPLLKALGTNGAMCCAVASAALFLGSSPAHSTFIVATNPSGDQFFNGDANKNVSSFTARWVDSIPDLRWPLRVGNVDTGAGFSNIKPIKDGSLTSLTFTPADPNLFADFSFRGQLEANAGGHVLLTVQDNQGNAPQVFSFSNLGANADFDRIGIVAAPGSGETIKSITLNSLFREQKQNEFSLAGAVPEPETYAMLGLGLALLGIALRRRDAI